MRNKDRIKKPDDSGIYEQIRLMLSGQIDHERSRDEVARRISCVEQRRCLLESDPNEIITSIESRSFHINDPELRAEIESSFDLLHPSDESLFIDMQLDFDIELESVNIIRSTMGIEPGVDLPEGDASIFYDIVSSGIPAHSISSLDTEEITRLFAGDLDGFIRIVYENGFFRNPERVAYQVSRSISWERWIESSKRAFISEYFGI